MTAASGQQYGRGAALWDWLPALIVNRRVLCRPITVRPGRRKAISEPHYAAEVGSRHFVVTFASHWRAAPRQLATGP